MACSDSNNESSNLVSANEGTSGDGTTGAGTATEEDTGGDLNGDGIVPDAICLNDQPIAGVLSLDDLVGLGIIIDSPVDLRPFELGDETICGLWQESDPSDSDEDLPLQIVYTKDEDVLQNTLDDINRGNEIRLENGLSPNDDFTTKSVGNLDVLVAGNTTINGYISFKQSNNLASTLKFSWIPQFIGNEDSGEVRRNTMESLVDLVIEQGLSFEQSDPVPTDWFVCDESNLGVTGADPAALMSSIGAATTDIEIDLDTDIVGARKCQAIVDMGTGVQNFFIEVSVLDTPRFGIDPVQEFLNAPNEDRSQVTIGTQLAGLEVTEELLGAEGHVLAAQGTVSVNITVKVPKEFEEQLGDLVLSVATDIVNRIPW